MSIEELRQTEAFKRRDAEWPSDQWDFTEWEECVAELEAGAAQQEKKA